MSGKRMQEAVRWFRQAFYDLEAARWNLKGEFYSTACFLCQQGAEKAMESMLYYLGARRQALLTHSLVDMVQEAGKTEPAFPELMDNARELDLHYIPSRYPNGLPGGYPHQFYGRKTAEQALGAAEAIFDAVRGYYEEKHEQTILRPD